MNFLQEYQTLKKKANKRTIRIKTKDENKVSWRDGKLLYWLFTFQIISNQFDALEVMSALSYFLTYFGRRGMDFGVRG